MDNESELDGYWHARARAEAARAEQLRKTVDALNKAVFELEKKLYTGRIVIPVPEHVIVLLRDLASAVGHPTHFAPAERAWLERVARGAADMLERHRED